MSCAVHNCAHEDQVGFVLPGRKRFTWICSLHWRQACLAPTVTAEGKKRSLRQIVADMTKRKKK